MQLYLRQLIIFCNHRFKGFLITPCSELVDQINWNLKEFDTKLEGTYSIDTKAISPPFIELTRYQNHDQYSTKRQTSSQVARVSDANRLGTKNPCGPNANPCRLNARPNASGRIWSRWVPLALGFALGMLILCCLYHFHSRWAPNANAVYGGIWALDFRPRTTGEASIKTNMFEPAYRLSKLVLDTSPFMGPSRIATHLPSVQFGRCFCL